MTIPASSSPNGIDEQTTTAAQATGQPENAPAAKAAGKATKRRSFRGLSLEERQNERREKLIEAGLQIYGTQGFFSVTVRDICNEAKLTERYFYESFKRSEELFKTIYLRLIEQLQQTILAAVMQSQGEVNPRKMIEAGLQAFFHTLRNDPRMARILFIDAILVHEIQGNTIYEAIARFDRMTTAFILLMFPKEPRTHSEISLIATGLSGYVIHIATRWVIGGFKEPLDNVLSACRIAYLSLMGWIENDSAKK